MLAVVRPPLPVLTDDAVTLPEGAGAGLVAIALEVPTILKTQVGPVKLEGAATGPPAFEGIAGTVASADTGPLAGDPEFELEEGAGAGAVLATPSRRQTSKHGSMLLQLCKGCAEVVQQQVSCLSKQISSVIWLDVCRAAEASWRLVIVSAMQVVDRKSVV